MEFNMMDRLAILLIIVGGVNWGLVGFFDYNLVDSIFGEESTLSRIVYAVVGLAALYAILSLTKTMSSESNRS